MAAMKEKEKEEKKEEKDYRLPNLILKKLAIAYGDETGKSTIEIIKQIQSFRPQTAEPFAEQALRDALTELQISNEYDNLIAIKGGGKTFMAWFSEKNFGEQISNISKKGKKPKK